MKENFEADLSSTIAGKCPYDLQEFELLFDETLGKHAPLKSVTIRGNNKPHMTKFLRKAMMLRTKLKNRANKTRDQVDMKVKVDSNSNSSNSNSKTCNY